MPDVRPTPDASHARRRVALFGGSFDPVHRGHVHAAQRALEAFDLDRVVFMPAARSPFKLERQLAPGADRLAMLAIAIRGEPRFVTSDLEIRRGGPSYTIDTVRDLPAAIGEEADVAIYLILGSDTLPGLPGWRSARDLLMRAQPIIVHRAGEPEAMLGHIAAELGPEIAARLRAGYLRLPPLVVSSTDVRAHLGRQDRALTYELPDGVLAYVRAHGLYESAP